MFYSLGYISAPIITQLALRPPVSLFNTAEFISTL